jgi:hypothetical protein
VPELRLQTARTLLTDRRHDRLKISDIAYERGFDSLSYFNGCFRRRFGASPMQYRGSAGPASGAANSEQGWSRNLSIRHSGRALCILQQPLRWRSVWARLRTCAGGVGNLVASSLKEEQAASFWPSRCSDMASFRRLSGAFWLLL